MPVTLVTGTSTGIGYATALHFARHGYRVVASMRNLAKAGPLEPRPARKSCPSWSASSTSPGPGRRAVSAAGRARGPSTSSSTTPASAAPPRSS